MQGIKKKTGGQVTGGVCREGTTVRQGPCFPFVCFHLIQPDKTDVAVRVNKDITQLNVALKHKKTYQCVFVCVCVYIKQWKCVSTFQS